MPKPKNKNNTSKKIDANLQNINYKYLINTRKFLVIALAISALAVGLVLFAIYPQITASLNLYQDLLKANKRLASLKMKNVQLADAAGSELINQIEQINQILPSKKPLLELMTSLNIVGKQSGVEFSDVSISPGSITETDKNKSNKLELELKAKGSLKQINNFLNAIEHMAPFTTVTSLKLNEKKSLKTAEQTADQFEADLEITSYFYTQAVTAQLDTPLPEFTATQNQILQTLENFVFPSANQNINPETIQSGGLEDLFGVQPLNN